MADKYRQTSPRRYRMVEPKAAGLEGLIAGLQLEIMPADARSEFLAAHGNNLGMSGHPAVIIGTQEQGRVATCLQMTSFGGTSLQGKYPNPSHPVRNQYLAIDQGNNSTVAPNAMPVLQLENRQAMDKQTYVHLDMFYQIETRYLTCWHDGRSRLTVQSVADLQHHFRRFLAGEIPRLPLSPKRPHSPLDPRNHGWTPEKLGIPPPSYNAQRMRAAALSHPDVITPARTWAGIAASNSGCGSGAYVPPHKRGTPLTA